MVGMYRLLFLCLFVSFLSANFCNGYLQRGLTQGDEIWQDGRPGWAAVIAYFGELWPGG